MTPQKLAVSAMADADRDPRNNRRGEVLSALIMSSGEGRDWGGAGRDGVEFEEIGDAGGGILVVVVSSEVSFCKLVRMLVLVPVRGSSPPSFAKITDGIRELIFCPSTSKHPLGIVVIPECVNAPDDTISTDVKESTFIFIWFFIRQPKQVML